MLGLFAVAALIDRDFWLQPVIPRIVQLPAGLIFLLLLQYWLGMIGYFDQMLLYILYLLFALLLMILGARLCASFGLTKLAQVLAIFLLVGAEASALIGVLQHYRWHTPLDPVITMKVASSVFGNLAQPNHFANYIALGLVSLGLVYRQQMLKFVYVVLLAAPLLFVMTLSGSRSSWLYLLMMTILAWWWTRHNFAERPLFIYSLLLLVGFGVMHFVVQLPFISGASSIDTVQRLFDNDVGSGAIRLYLWREAVIIFMQSPWLGVGFGQFAWHHFQLLPVLQGVNIVGLYNNAHNLIFQLAAEAGVAGLLVLFGSLGIWLRGLRGATFDAAHWWGYVALGVLCIHSLLEYPLWYVYFVAVAAFLLGALDKTSYLLELRNVGRMSMGAILLMGLLTLMQLRIGYLQLEQMLRINPASITDQSELDLLQNDLSAVQGGSLLSPYAELFMSSQIEVSSEHIKEKLELNSRVMHFAPIDRVVYRQAMLLAKDDRLQDAMIILEQSIWSFPEGLPYFSRQMEELAEKDPAHFSALLKFALQKDQEHQRAVYHK